MKELTTYTIAFALVISCVYTPQTFAHNGVEHTTETEAVTHEEFTAMQMRTLIAVLQKLLVLLQTKHAAEQAGITEDIVIPSMVVEPIDAEEEIVIEQDEIIPIQSSEEQKKLVVEVEEHHGSTHVHVRFPDKPEIMFFVSSPVSDEDGVVRESAARAGLSEDEVRAALVFLGM